MLPISKLSAGIWLGIKALRVTNLWGAVLDAIGERAKEVIEIATPLDAARADGVAWKATIPSSALTITVSVNTVVITESAYDRTRAVNSDEFLTHVENYFTAIDAVLKLKHVRRIGVVAEYRKLDVDDPAGVLQSALSTSALNGEPHSFVTRMSVRRPLTPGARIEPSTDAYIGVIRDIYDAMSDAEVKEERAFNVNVDVQRYYAPLLERGYVDEVKALYRKEFTSEWRVAQAELQRLGLVK